MKKLFLLAPMALLVSSMALAQHQPHTIIQAADMRPFTDDTMSLGGAYIIRDMRDAEVQVKFSTTGLEPGTAQSVWFIAFNSPWNCVTPWLCSSADFADPSLSQASGVWMGGFIVDDDVEDFYGEFNRGKVTGRDWIVSEIGLTSLRVAEIHIATRSHGQAKAPMGEQTATFNANCNPDCANTQFAVFRSPKIPEYVKAMDPFAPPAL